MMAVYTPVSDAQAAKLLEGYDIGHLVRLIPITQGVENTNYHLITEGQRYILTLFEKRTDPEGLPFVFSFMKHLAAHGVACPMPVEDRKGNIITQICGRPAAIVQYLNGDGITLKQVKASHCRQLGETLARMHKLGEGFLYKRHNPVGYAAWQKLYDAVGAKAADKVAPGLARAIETALAEVEPTWREDLPSGAIHADVFPDNVFFDEHGRLTGVIDFYFACSGAFVYDLTLAINAWCLDVEGRVRPDCLTALMQSYIAVRPLNAYEIQALPRIRRAAALRMLLTRLYDWINTPADADVVRKDPLEYMKKLVADVDFTRG